MFKSGQLVRYTKEHMRKSYGETGILLHNFFIPHPDGGNISAWKMLLNDQIKIVYDQEIEEINV